MRCGVLRYAAMSTDAGGHDLVCDMYDVYESIHADVSSCHVQFWSAYWNAWIMFDDSRVKTVGTWKQVYEECIKGYAYTYMTCACIRAHDV